MSVYAASDLHGYPIDEFKALLKKVNFCDSDYLFILGDVIDRGNDGVKYLLWLMNQYNVQLLLGNHEAMLLSCKFIFDDITEDSLRQISSEKMDMLSNWTYNGGLPTINALKELCKNDPDAVQDILDYLDDAPLFETVSVNDRDFLLTHSGMENFSPERKFSSYAQHELIWYRPSLNQRYFDDIITIFGHTPTQLYGPEYKGKILKTDTWINIDTSAGHGGKPSLLRLDDLAEIYLD